MEADWLAGNDLGLMHCRGRAGWPMNALGLWWQYEALLVRLTTTTQNMRKTGCSDNSKESRLPEEHSVFTNIS